MHQLEILPRPPEHRAPNNPWPQWPVIFRTSSAHEEGVERVYSVSTKRFVGANGRVTALELVKIEMTQENGRTVFKEVPGDVQGRTSVARGRMPGATSEFQIPADLVLLAMGFVSPEKPGMLEKLGAKLTERGNVWRDAHWMTSVKGVFTAGDMQRGQSLIVWAIAEGRSAARGVDQYLMGASDLPAPL